MGGGKREMDLRPYQVEARQAVRDREAAGVRSLVTVLPTGTGKTVLFASEIADRAAGGRVLVLAHRDELIQQPLEALARVAPGLEVGTVKAAANEAACRVVVASVQTLARPKRLEAYAAQGAPALVITDECHHAVASTYRGIYEALGAGTDTGPLHLGYTATPQRLDEVGLEAVFAEVAFARDIREMVIAGWLVEPRGRIVAVMDLAGVRRNESGDYSDSGLDEAFDDRAVQAIAAAWHTYAANRTTVAFTPTVRTAEALADAAAGLVGAGRVAVVHGGTPPDERRDILRRLKAGELRLVANCMVLTEGFDGPNIDCILVARPTKSEALYTQMVGRGLRLYPGKDDCLVLDVTGISKEHSLCVLPVLFGLPVQDMEGKTVSVAAEEAVAAAKRRGMRLAQESALVDLLRRRKRWAWTEVDRGRLYSVSLGRDTCVVVRGQAPQGTPCVWVAEVRTYGADRRLADCRSLFRGDGETASEDAFGAAETYLATVPPEHQRLAAGDGRGWRKAAACLPATEAQLRALDRWHIAVPAGVTKAQASDLLDQAISRARLRGA